MTMVVIVDADIGGYAHRKSDSPKAVMTVHPEPDLEAQRADLEKQLRAGKPLKSGAVAIVLGVGRTKVHTLLKTGKIRYTLIAGGKQRLCNPEDVLRLLEDSRRMWGDDPNPDAEQSTHGHLPSQ